MKEVDEQVVSYITTMLKRGYLADQVFDAMKEQGYSEASLLPQFHYVNDTYYQGNLAFDKLHTTQHHSHLALIAVSIFLVIGVIVGAYMLFFVQTNFIGLTDLDTRVLSDEYGAGEVVQLEVDLLKSTSEVEQILISYSVLNSDQVIVVQEQETRTITESLRFLTEFSDLEAGEYSLVVKAESSGSEFSSISSFSIVDVVTGSDESLLALMLAQESPEDGLTYCEQIDDAVLSRECYYYLALQAEYSGACSELESSEKEDCYSNLIINGQLEFCDVTENDRTRELCSRIINI